MTNNFLPKVMNPNTGCGKILIDMYVTEDVVSGEDYCDIRNGRPFIGYNANARLSELLGLGFVEKVGLRKNQMLGGQPMFEYKITFSGIERAKYLISLL
ncbi:hypothetical protein DLH72_01245 [Candidatus Gracilibacteria bacterium]|nr:MAG: hypothetical protein DLH72_01245 [Candidatus Gracilibacteria bacterium]